MSPHDPPPPRKPSLNDNRPHITALSAVTLAVADMRRAVDFYRAAGFPIHHGGTDADFTSFAAGSGYLNLFHVERPPETAWGRAIFHVDDVDAMHARLVAHGVKPEFEPRDAAWGERYFHVRDPDGHEISFARPLE
jgi:catechol 2,3-dioxygenase-like lactoylglutathione lyase family enzyme